MHAPIADAHNPDVVDTGRPEQTRRTLACLHNRLDSEALDAATKVLRVGATMSVLSM